MWQQLVNFNNAGSSKVYEVALEAQIAHLRLESEVGGYEAAGRNSSSVKFAYDAIASLVGCESTDIAFMDSASRAWNYFLYSLPLKHGDVILTGRNEFGTNIVTFGHIAQKTGASVILVDVEKDGRISLNDLDHKLNSNVALVAFSHIPMHRGVINPVQEIGKLVKQQGRAIYLLDACQSAGQVSLNVRAIGCDACTGTGRKWLRGPRGTGFLYVKSEIANQIDPVTVDLTSAEVKGDVEHNYFVRVIETARRFETWERSVAGLIGLGAAVNAYLQDGPEATHRVIAKYARLIREGLIEQGHDVCENIDSPVGITTFVPRSSSAADIKSNLAEKGYGVSTVQRFDAPVDFDDRDLRPLVRVSPHAYNGMSEIEGFLRAMSELSRD